MSKASESRNVLSYFDLLIDISNVDIVFSVFDRRGAFDFDIVNFVDLCGNFSTAPAYGTYNSQLMVYNQACRNFDNFSSRYFMLAERLLNQGFSVRKLMGTFYKFMGRFA